MGGFLVLLGWLLWGREGISWLLFSGFLLMMLNPVATPGLIMRLYHARPLSVSEAPGLHANLRELARRAGLRHPPRLYYIPSRMVNAFAVGNAANSSIALTDGLLRLLDERELTGVLAHEISHVRNNDLWVMGIADLFSRLTSVLSLFGQLLLFVNLPLLLVSGAVINWYAVLLLIFAPNLSALAQLGLSRSREYHADLNAVLLTGDPEGLASALLKLESAEVSAFEQILWPGRRLPEPSLLRTHPPTEERIRRLMSLESPHADAVSASISPAWKAPPSAAGLGVPRRHLGGLWF
ncbi:MAG TPA: peptidase M48 [Chromatiaceae bacterium]|nr:peptidase M48 [Chromatiaceae bacterium]